MKVRKILEMKNTSEEYFSERDNNIIKEKFCDFYNEKYCTEKWFYDFCLCKKMLFDMNSASSLTADKDFKFRLIASRDLEPDKNFKGEGKVWFLGNVFLYI